MQRIMGRLRRWQWGFAAGVLGALLVVGVQAQVFHIGRAAQVVDYTLEIMPKDIEYDGGVWHAWTFNGTVPGPTLNVKAGDTLRVRVINHLGMVASFHAHMDGYSLENDGSQANMITGIGMGGILEPDSEYTYEFQPPTPGLFYYHTHSADKGLPPSMFVGQGLYGAIVVADPDRAPMREEVLFMGEIGHEVEGKVPPYIMNAKGLLGGEVALETTFKEQGLAGVTRLFDRSLPVFKVKTNERLRLHVVNIGDQMHSLYIHQGEQISVGALGGRPWPGKVIPLVPGAADTLEIKFSKPGMWLFHCHVESHADAGMVGLFLAE